MKTLKGFTEKEMATVRAAASQTYNAVACDMEGAPLAEVAEVIVDADRLVTLGGLDRGIHKRLDAIPYKTLIAWVRKEIL